MGGQQSQEMKSPLEICDFRKINSPLDQYVIPEMPEKRKVTDLKCTVSLAICFAILVPLLCYTLVNSDIGRLTQGYDKCGNVCGKRNPFIEGIACSGQDMTDKPFLSGDNIQELECVDWCSPGKMGNSNCETQAQYKIDPMGYQRLLDDINKSSGSIVLMCIIGVGLSFLMLALFRYYTAAVVWIILIGSTVALIAAIIFVWVLVLKSGEFAYTYLLIVLTIFKLGLIVVLICVIKRTHLVITLFEQSIKIIFEMPLMIFEPFLTVATQLTAFFISMVGLVYMSTAGVLQGYGDTYVYLPNTTMIFTFFYFILLYTWMTQFFVGCQHMVISGAVSQWYFSRDKRFVGSPIRSSFYNLVRFHLGTVAFGSLITTVVIVIRFLLRALARNRLLKVVVDCCFSYLEGFIRYLTRNAYIQTAMHGQPFYKSGKRAVRLLAANALNAIAVSSIGDFVLFMAQLFIILVTAGIGYAVMSNRVDVENQGIPILVAVIVTAVVAYCFFQVFKITIDTMFLCYCEDKLMNDGVANPFYTTTGFMLYVEVVTKKQQK